MPITSLYANTCTEIQDAAGRGSGHPSRIIPSPHYDSFERERLYGASNFLQPFRKWRKVPLHPDLDYYFQREKEFLPVDANQDVLEALALQDRRPLVCLPSLSPECQMCLG